MYSLNYPRTSRLIHEIRFLSGDRDAIPFETVYARATVSLRDVNNSVYELTRNDSKGIAYNMLVIFSVAVRRFW